MAQNENYSQVDLRVGTEAQFNAKVDTLPAGTLFGITDATVSKADLSTDLKNEINGKYSKPSGGIPKTDLASSVQTSLAKADSALQSHQSVKLESGTNNGTLKLTVNGTSTDNIAVKNLGSAAFTATSNYATAAQGAKADRAIQKPSNPTTESAITINSSGTVSTKPLSSITGKTEVYVGSTTPTNPDEILWINPDGNSKYESLIDSKYTKPEGGIPKSDLSSEVQSSPNKANTALQSHQTITTGTSNGTISVAGTNVSVKGLGSLAYKSSLTKSDVGLGNVDNTSDKAKPISTATQNALNGKYTKPTGGIPKSDLASGVQTSLGKADTALQSHQTITTGSTNGTISVGGTNVSVKGLGSLAYKSSVTKSDVGLGNVVNAGQDSTPTANSSNYVTSGGVKSYVDTATSLLGAYPVGAIYISYNRTDPGSLFGGSWTQLKDRFLLAAGTSYTAGSTGGEATHTLTESEIPEHSHSDRLGWLDDHKTNNPLGINGTALTVISNPGNARVDDPQAHVGLTGGSKAHNNMPPYLTVYMWKRVS